MTGPTRPTRSRQTDLAIIALLLVAVVIAFFDVIGPERGLVFRDHLAVFKPRWWNVAESIRALRLPALTRATAEGVPLELFQNGTYTPMTLLLLLGDFDVVYDWFIALHVFLLGAGVYLLARELEAERRGALLAAAIAAFSGPVLSFENLFVALQALAWAPWVLYGFWRCLSSPGPGAVALFGAAAGFQVQAIMPELLLLDGVGGLLLIAHHRKLGRAQVASIVIGGVLAIGVGAIGLMPVLEGLPYSRRGAGFDYAEASTWSFRAAQLLDLIAPAIWNPPESTYLNVPSVTGDDNGAYLLSLYAGSGLLFLPLALAGGKERLKMTVGLLVLLVLFALVAAGPATPLHRALASMPLLRSARYPIKYLTLSVAAAAALAPLGLARAERMPRVVLAGGAAFAAILAGALEVLEGSETAQRLSSLLVKENASPLPAAIQAEALPAQMIEHMGPRLSHGLLFFALLAAIAAVAMIAKAGADPVKQRRFGWALASLVVLDLSFAARSSIAGADLSPTPDPALHQRIRGSDHRVYFNTPFGKRARVAVLEGESWLDAATRSSILRGEVSYRDVRYLRDVDSDAQSNPWSAMALKMLPELRSEDEATRFFGRLGVSWVTSWLPPEPRPPDLLRFEIPGESPQWLRPIPNARPYLFLTSKARFVPAGERTMRALARLATAPELVGTALILGDPPAVEREDLAALTSTTSACDPAPSLETLEIFEGRVKAKTRAGCPTVLEALETRMHGWTASIDGEGAALLDGELGDLAVVVPRGEHEVVFEYVPAARRWVPLWLLSLAALVGLAGAELVRRARDRSAA